MTKPLLTTAKTLLMTKPLLTKQRRKTLSGSKSNIYNKVITIDVFWAEEPELKRQESPEITNNIEKWKTF